MRIGVKIAITAVLFFADPFGLKSATNDESVEIFSRLTAPFYAGSKDGIRKPNIGQDQISVVLMNDRAAETLNPGGGYPVPLATHGEVLKAILCAGAKAVFVDINFRWERSEGDAGKFVEHLRHRPKDRDCRRLTNDELRQSHHAPLIFGHIKSATSECDPMSLAEQKARCLAMPGFRELNALIDYVDLITLPPPKTDLRYVLQEGGDGYLTLVSPARRTLDSLCREDKRTLQICADLKSLEDRTMVVRWGWWASARENDLKAWLGGRCDPDQAPLEKGLMTQIESAALSSLGAVKPFYEFWFGKDFNAPGHCAYHDTIIADRVIQAAQYGDQKPSTGDWTGNDVLRRYFAGRVVFYGLDITGVGDFVKSPTLQTLPGVYVHAMALDNLITLGTSHWREPCQVFGISLSKWIDFGLSVIFLVFGHIIGERNDHDFRSIVRNSKAGNPVASERIGGVLRPIWLRFDALLRLLKRRPAYWLAVSQGASARMGRVLFWRMTRGGDPMDEASAYDRHRQRNRLFVGITVLTVIAVMLIESYGLHWPPNDWIVLFAIIGLTKPPLRKRDEWVAAAPAA